MSGDILFCDVGGPPDGPVLLLIHAMGADRRFWDECRRSWADRYRCVAVDLRGAGASPKTDAPVSMREHAADIERLRIAHRLGPVHVVGCAVGAMIAAVYAARFPAQCRALILSNPGFRIDAAARTALSARSWAIREDGLASILPQTLDSTFDSPARSPIRDAFERQFVAQDAMQYAYQIDSILDADISDILGDLTMPVFLVAGERDKLLPPSHARAIAEALAGSELVTLEQGAHFIPLQLPVEFARLVEDFLGRVVD